MSEDIELEQIAQVFVDLLSVDTEQDEDAYVAQLNLAQGRLTDLRAVSASVDVDGSEIHVTLGSDAMVGGAVIALGALLHIARDLSGLSSDELITRLREQIDHP